MLEMLISAEKGSLMKYLQSTVKTEKKRLKIIYIKKLKRVRQLVLFCLKE